MSQKAIALEAYTELVTQMNSHTKWGTLRTAGVTLVTQGEEIPNGDSEVAAFIDAKVEQLVHNIKEEFLHFPMFVRACPLNPRPGVLESSVAKTWDEVRTVATRIITTMMSPDPSDTPMYESGLTDPNGTVIVQRYINADASAVVSPNHYIIMGRDNDGVTAGKDGIKVSIPVSSCHDTSQDLHQLGIDKEKIELEFVSELRNVNDYLPNRRIPQVLRNKRTPQQDTAVVQLRGCDGPRPIGTPPKGVTISGTFHGADRITIKHIHLVSDNTEEQLDLMEQALREGMPDGSVVLHPNGTHLSHHAGQCLKYGVPYIASTEPQVGEQWTQAALGWVVLDNDGDYEPQPYDPMDYTAEFIEGFNRGHTNFARQHGWLSNHFHQFIGGPINDPAECAMYAGGYVAWLINATMSVGLGELRHISSNTVNATLLPISTVVALYGKDAWVEVQGNDLHLTDNRQSFYMMIEQKPINMQSTVQTLEFIMACYKLEWGSGYGGDKYHDSCRNARDLAVSVLEYMAKPNKNRFKSMLSNANLTEHNVHNNDYFFSKFIAKRALNWGTDPTTVTITPESFFSVYYAARDIMDSSVRETIDTTDILWLSRNITKKGMKAKPLGLQDHAIGKAVSFVSEYQRHPNGMHSDYTLASFIPCGVNGCDVCLNHTTYIQNTLSSTNVPIEQTYDAPFPNAEEKVDDLEAGALNWLKTTSKKINDGELNNLGDAGWWTIATQLGDIFNSFTIPTSHHKYVSNIIGSFNTAALKAFTDTKEE